MANQRQDVELRIRATNYASKSTDEVAKSLKDLIKVEEAQIAAANKGTVSVAQLEAGYGKLEAAAKALLSQQSLIKLFQSQSATLTELETKLAAARKAQKDFSDTLVPGATRTAAQEAAMKKLSAAVGSMEKQFERAQGRVDSTGKRLNAFGINAANLAEAQAKITQSVNGANEALARQERAIQGADSGASKRKAAAEAIAQREQQIKVDNLFAQAERDVAAALEKERQAQIAATAAAAASQNAAAAAAAKRAAAEALAQREQQVRVDNLFAQTQREVAAALEKERQAQIAATAAAAAAQREKQIQADIIFTNAEREAAEAVARKTVALNLQRAALMAAADAAERMARGSVTTARGTGPVISPDLAARLRDIANPSQAALRSISGIEAAVKGLETRVTQIRGPVQDYRGALEAATRAQAALSAVAGQVDGYQRQLSALRAARQEFSANRAAVATLVAEMRSGAAGDDITTRLARAQAVLQASAASMGNLTTSARTARDALRAAGIDTSNLTNAEAALIAQATRAAGATNSLTDAFRRNGAAANESGSRILNFFGGGGGRTTLSYMQRIRGEVLGLAAGFVGLNAVIDVGKKALDSYAINQGIMSRLLIANGGDAKKAGDDYKYLQEQADRIGFVFQKIAPAYTKFAIAAKAANFTSEETRFTFEQIAASSVKARLKTEELEGVMKAFEQIMSKGTVQAEELRGQLGDRLPGAFQIAARAANMSVEAYTKSISLGEQGADQVIAIARELGKTYGAASQGAGGLLEAQARFQNAADRFLTSTAEGGFVQAYQGFLAKLTTLLNSGQGDKLAQQLSAGFTAVIDVLGFVADHIDGISFAIKALIGLSFLKWLASLPLLIAAVRTELLLVNAQMGIFQAFLARSLAASALTTALGATGLTGVLARLTPALVGCGTALLFMARAIPVIGAAIAAYQATRFIVDSFDDDLRTQVKNTIKATTAASNEAEKASIAYNKARGTREENALKAEYEKKRDLAVELIKKQAILMEKAKNIDLGSGVAAAANDQNTAARPDLAPTGTADPGDRKGDVLRKLKKELEAEDKRSEKAARAARMKSAKEELADRLEIIDEPFKAKRDAMDKSKMDEAEYAKAIEMINASSLKAQNAERMKFNNEQQKQGEAANEKRKALAFDIKQKLGEIEDDIAKRTAVLDASKPFEERRLARVKAIGNAYDEVAKKIMREKKFAPGEAEKDQAKLDFLVKERQELESQNAYRDEANRLMDVFNQKQAIIKAMQDEINTKAESGAISAQTALEQQNKVLSDIGPGVAEAGNAALDFARKFQAMLDPVVFQQSVATITADMAKLNVGAGIATNNLKAQQEALNLILEQQSREVEAITLKRSLGLIGSEQEAAALNRTTTEYKPKIMEATAELLKLLEVSRALGAVSEESYAKAKAGAENLATSTQYAHAATSALDQTIQQSITTNAVSAFETLGTEIAKVASGAESIGDGFRGALAAIGQFFAQLLRDIALAIIKQIILNALVSMGGGIGGAAVQAGGAIAGAMHTGGVVGRDRSFTRRVDPAIFAGAQRLHTGGIPGIKTGEVPTILQKNEEVLTRNDPRHVLNGGKNAGSDGNGGGGGNRFVLVDDRKGVAQAMATSEGEKVMMVHLKNNLPTIKQWVR